MRSAIIVSIQWALYLFPRIVNKKMVHGEQLLYWVVIWPTYLSLCKGEKIELKLRMAHGRWIWLQWRYRWVWRWWPAGAAVVVDRETFHSRWLPPKDPKHLYLAVNLGRSSAPGTGENLILPPKQTILRNLAVNEAPHGLVSAFESNRLPPKVAKLPNLAVNTYETAQTQSFRMY